MSIDLSVFLSAYRLLRWLSACLCVCLHGVQSLVFLSGACLPAVLVALASNFASVAVGVCDASGGFAAGVGDAGDGFAAGVGGASGGLPPELAAPVVALLPVSTAPVANNGNNIRLQTS